MADSFLLLFFLFAFFLLLFISFSLGTVSFAFTEVVTNASLVVIAGVDGVRSLPFDRVTLCLTRPALIEVGHGITITSSWEAACQIAACQSGLVFFWKFKELQEVFIIV